MVKDKDSELLEQESTIDFKKEIEYSVDDFKTLFAFYFKSELEKKKDCVDNCSDGLSGSILKASKDEGKFMSDKFVDEINKKINQPIREDQSSCLAELKKKESIHQVKRTIHLEQSIKDLPVPEIITKKLIEAGILNVNQLVNLSTLELYKILKRDRYLLKCVYKVIGNNVAFDTSTKNEEKVNKHNNCQDKFHLVHCDTIYGPKNYWINENGKWIPLSENDEELYGMFEWKHIDITKYLKEKNIKLDELSKILAFLKENKKINISKIQIILSMSFKQASNYIGFLIEHNVLSKQKDKDGYYQLNLK